MLFAIICTYKPGGDVLRKPIRARHLEYMIAALPYTVYGGSLTDDDAKRATGMVVVVERADRDGALAFIRSEPYYKAGLFESVVVRRVRQMTPEIPVGLLTIELDRERARVAREKARGANGTRTNARRSAKRHETPARPNGAR